MEGKLIKLELSEGYRLDDLNGNYIASTLNGKNKLSLKNCLAIENGYDLDELADENVSNIHEGQTDFMFKEIYREFFKEGFQKAIELLGDKKYTETELYHAFLINSAGNNTTLRNFFEQTVLPMIHHNEWDVEIEMDICGDKVYAVPEHALDENGCLILKRK